jgi:16S rRNA (cytosine967-C5)-methyltransferase
MLWGASCRSRLRESLPEGQTPAAVLALVARALDGIEAGVRADRALAQLLRAHPGLSSSARAAVAFRSLGMTVWRGRLAWLADDDRPLAYAAFMVEQEGVGVEAAAVAAGIDAARLHAALARVPPEDPVQALSMRWSLPAWLAKRWLDQFGPEAAEAVATAMNRRAPVTIRANRLRNDAASLAEALAGEGVRAEMSSSCDTALTLEGRPNIVMLDAWREGRFEVQDEASQRAILAAQARPEMLVADLCSGSGGKSLGLAAEMQDRGRIVAIELNPARIDDHRVRLRRAGIGCVELRCGDLLASEVSADLEGRCDLVFLDVPCSETGVLRRSPDARWRLPANAPDVFAPVQRRMLARAERLVRPGGRVVYVTCSIDRAENEGVSGAPPAGLSREWSRTLRPDTDGCDGFHIARFVKQ